MEYKENKNPEKSNAGCAIIVFIFIILPMLVGLLIRCLGGKGKASWDDDSPWEPRHTQIYTEKAPPSYLV